MPFDPFANSGNSLTAPAADCFAITPDDANPLPRATKAVYIGTGGNLVVRLVESETDIAFVNVLSGTILDIRVAQVRQAGTTAADIVGLV